MSSIVETVEEPVEAIAPVENAATEEQAPAPDAAADEESPATEAAPGQPRGPDGKFLPKQAATESETVEEAATELPVDGTPPLTEPATDSAAVTEAPWSMKVDGQTFGLEGAVVIPGKGVLFPEQHAGVIHKLLARGIQYEQERPAWKQQQQREREGLAAEKAQLSVIGELATTIFAAKDENELAEIIVDLWQNRATLQREADFRRRQAELDARDKALAPTPEQQQYVVESQLGESIGAAFAEAKTAPWAKGLTAQDWTALQQVMEPVRGSFLVRAPEDMPDRGLRQGDLAFDADRFFDVLQRQAGLLTTERKRLAEDKTRRDAAAKAAAQNTAARTPSVKAPPSVASAEKPAPSGSEPVFTSKDEYDAWIRKVG